MTGSTGGAVAKLDPAMIERIMLPDPAASLRASATAFEALGRPFDADFSRQLADGAAIDPRTYRHWAREQAERVARFQGERA